MLIIGQNKGAIVKKKGNCTKNNNLYFVILRIFSIFALRNL